MPAHQQYPDLAGLANGVQWSRPTMLSAGTRIGPFEIVGAIGSGDMGDVYRGHDAALRRDVAIKILPEIIAADPDRLARLALRKPGTSAVPDALSCL